MVTKSGSGLSSRKFILLGYSSKILLTGGFKELRDSLSFENFDQGIILSLFHSLKRFIVFTAIRLGVFIMLFKENIGPTWKLFQKSFGNIP